MLNRTSSFMNCENSSLDDKPGHVRVHSQYPAGHRPASSGSWLSIIGLLVMRSLGIGTSSSHRGFVAEFGWLGFGKHPMKDQITSPHATKSTKGIRTIIINLATCT